MRPKWKDKWKMYNRGVCFRGCFAVKAVVLSDTLVFFEDGNRCASEGHK